MFRKILMFLIVALFAMTPVAFAWNTQVADGYLEGNSYSDEFTSARSNWRGNSNDRADSSAVGNAGGDVTTHASGIGYATESSSLDASSEAGGSSFAQDYGQKSIAGAESTFEGQARTTGAAWGVFGDRETVDSNVYVDGYVHQYNTAGETGYPSGSGISGENYSQGSFLASDHDFEQGGRIGLFGVRDTNSVSGSAIASGFTGVKGDFYGNQRSIEGITHSSANINVPSHLTEGAVQGSGTMSGVIAKGNTYAGGTSTYNFTGVTSGSGQAALDANISVGGNSSSVSVSGSSSSVGN